MIITFIFGINFEQQKYEVLISLLLFSLISFVTKAQITPEESQKIKILKTRFVCMAIRLINSEEKDNRTIASYRIIKTLTKALKVNNSFYYRWDSTLPMENYNS
jgi:hypothetical protein